MTGPTERCWFFDTLAVIIARVDFLDPALIGAPAARERGVRVEIRPVQSRVTGSHYSSPELILDPAVCRIDLLESAPGAADRMHWHPVMEAGEPGDRTFEPAMVKDPCGWLTERLHHVGELLEQSGTSDVGRHHGAIEAIGDSAAEIVEAAKDGLAWAAQPWPRVQHDERGMATCD